MNNQNFQSDDASGGTADQDKDRARHRSAIQREMIMQEADLRRSVNEKAKLEVEIRQLKNDEAHIKISLQEREARLNRLAQDISRAEAEMKELKKKLNVL